MFLALLGLIVVASGLLVALKISRKPFWGVMAVFFFLPFERIPTIDLAGFTLKINYFLGGLVIAVWLVELLKRKRPLSRHPANLFLWLLISAFLLSFAKAVDPVRSVIFFAQAVFVLALFGVIVNQIQSADQLDQIARIIFYSTWVVVLFALYQFVGDYLGLPTGLDQGYTRQVLGFPRVQAFSKEPLYLANFLFIPFGLMIGYCMQKEKPVPRHAYLLLPGMVLIFLLTVSRGAYLGLAVFGLVSALWFGRRLIHSRAFMMASGALVIAGMILVATLVFLGPTTTEKFVAQATAQDIQLSSESIFGRLRAYGQAIDVWQQSPYTGVGLGGFGPATGETLSTGFPIVNNQYLELLAETGLVGLILFSLMTGAILAVAIRVWFTKGRSSLDFSPAMSGGLVAALAATLVQYNFFSTFSIIHIWVLIALNVVAQSLVLKTINDNTIKMYDGSSI